MEDKATYQETREASPAAKWAIGMTMLLKHPIKAPMRYVEILAAAQILTHEVERLRSLNRKNRRRGK